MTKPMFAELAGHVDYIAARFLPGGFLHFLGDSMSNLTDHIFPLDMLSGREGHNLVERLVSRNRIEERIRLLEVYFTRLLSENNKSDSVVRGALGVILEKHGNIRISDLAGIAGSSERQLHRKFDRWVGVGPKTFCKIIRFQNVCRMLGSGPKHGVLSAALDAGYYDQSHFIHEFSSLYGLRPIEFLQCKKF
jgi:AraC-like DNA-binding protein